MNPDHLRRYTDLAAALRMLKTKSITLLPPSTWDDRNDKNLMAAYQQRMRLKSVLALCFTQAAETYHHWKVFCPGKDGLCIVFEKSRLLAALDHLGVRHSSVEYFTLKRLREHEPTPARVPFSKRAAYRDEKEFRLLFESAEHELKSKDFEFPVAAVDRILINPWLAEPLANTVRQVINSAPGFENLEVLQSTVIDGPAWRAFANKVAEQGN